MPIKTALTSRDIEKIIDQTTNIRDRLIMMFYFDCGIRCSELLSVKYGNIDLEKKTVLISHLKRGTHKICPLCSRRAGRTTPFCSKCGFDLSDVEAVGIAERKRLIDIGDDLVKIIREYIKLYPGNPEELLIKLTRQSIYYLFRRLSKGAGLGGQIMLNPETGRRHYVHPHDARAALATDWLEYAKDDANKQKALQDFLGHVDFATTMSYNRLRPEAISKTRNEVRNFRKRKEEK